MDLQSVMHVVCIAFILAVGLSPLGSHAVSQPQAGARAEGCAVAYNNRFYVLGGWQDDVDPSPNFMSTSLPFNTTNNATWDAHPEPEAWKGILNGQKATCAMSPATGRLYLFGNGAGASVFDMKTNLWTLLDNFVTAPLTLPQFRQQGYLQAATHLDGSTISILVTNPPTYFRLDTLTDTVIATANVPSFYNLTGFCSTVHPITDQFIACGGTFYSPLLNPNNWSNNTCTVFGTKGEILSQEIVLSDSQYECVLVPSKNSLVILPGLLDSYSTDNKTVLPPYNAPFEITNGTEKSLIKIPNTSYGIQFGMFVVAMPGTGKAIIYGGWSYELVPIHQGLLLMVKTWVLDLNTLMLGDFIEAATELPSYGGSTTTSTDSIKKNGMSTASLVGCIVGGLIVLSLVVVGGVIYYRRRKRGQQQQESKARDPQEGTADLVVATKRTVQCIPEGDKDEYTLEEEEEEEEEKEKVVGIPQVVDVTRIQKEKIVSIDS